MIKRAEIRERKERKKRKGERKKKRQQIWRYNTKYVLFSLSSFKVNRDRWAMMSAKRWTKDGQCQEEETLGEPCTYKAPGSSKRLWTRSVETLKEPRNMHLSWTLSCTKTTWTGCNQRPSLAPTEGTITVSLGGSQAQTLQSLFRITQDHLLHY